MGRLYRYAFYRIHQWALELHGESDLPELTAVGILTLSVFANLVTAVLFLDVCGVSLLASEALSQAVGVAVLLALGLATHQTWVRGERLGRLIEEFEQRDPVSDPRGGLYVALYATGSPAILIASMLAVAIARS